MTFIWLILPLVLVSSIGECSRSKRDAKLLVNSDHVPPTEISQELQYKKYENHFPVPVLENVYEGWDPVDHGHPLKDETLYYAPPSLERVVFNPQGPQSRSIDAEVFKRPKGPIVIPAQPKQEPKNQLYSVYGSPDINYSALYERPPASPQSRTTKRINGIRNDGREFYLNSALDSRSADTRDYPLLWGPYHRREEPNALEPVESHGGGLQMIKPPNRKKKTTEYFYYREDSPYYKEKLNKKPNREELDNEIISIDGIIIGPKNSIPSPPPPPARGSTNTKYPEDLQIEESRIRQHQVRQQVPTAPPTKANAVVYSFKNDFGLKEQVGVIYEENPETSQVTKVFGNNNNNQNQQHSANKRFDNFRENVGGPSTGLSSLSSGQPKGQVASNFIPLEKKPEVKSQAQSFPLGNPFGSPLLKARPEFFPPLHYPPLFKTKPAKLEGSFGPPLPPKPEPDVIHFPDEELPGVVREQPRYPQRPHHNHNTNYRYHQQPPPRVLKKLPRIDGHIHSQAHSYVYKTVRDMDYSRPKDILSVKPSGELYIPDPREAHAPLGDVQPRVPILPGVSSFEDLKKFEEERKKKVEQELDDHIIHNKNKNNGHNNNNQEQQQLDEADDRIWKADFSDVDPEAPAEVDQNTFGVPNLSDFFTAVDSPYDLDSSGSIRDPVVFQTESSSSNNDQYRKPGSSFKFPGQSTGDKNHNQNTKHSHQSAVFSGNRKPPPDLMDKLEPHYSVIIGLNYDDGTPDVVIKDYEDDFQDDDPSPYSTEELYELCIKEVPSHLHRELCGYIRDGKPASGIPATKQLPPKQSRLIQDNNPYAQQGGFQPNSYEVAPSSTSHEHNPFAGIPTELPVQINKNPLVITSNSKVKIYKPFEDAPRVATTTTSPPTTTTTASRFFTSSITTTRPQRPTGSPPASALPPPPPPPPPSPQRNHRPLIFNKRDPNTGETKLSQPFEYFNRLTQFFNNRIHSSQSSQQQRRRPPPPPRLQRQRIRLPSTPT